MKSNNDLIVIVLLLTIALASAEIKDKGWWKHTVFYQIYPRSFKDSDNDGIGDLKGITSKLQYLADTGIEAIWLSPIFKSPMVDFGYDVQDFTEVDPIFGTLNDFKELASQAKKLGLKLILDIVPNHTSNRHLWFLWSFNATGAYKDYYIWEDGKIDSVGNRHPPNNWLSVFNGSAWKYNEQRGQYYFHQFYPEQPELNYSHPGLRNEMKKVLTFWLDQGVDGFRIDAVPHLFENNVTQNEPSIDPSDPYPNEHASLIHTLTKDQPQTYDLIRSWRDYLDEYADERNQSEKVILTEAYTSWDNTIKYYHYGSNVPFNFKLITDVNSESNAYDFKYVIDKWLWMMPKGKVSNWVLGNHDRVRVGTRFPGRGDQMIMLEMMLPGIAVTYYGEEIGMVDNTTLKIYDFRDGCRTPFQWDDTKNAGFNDNGTTWLPVNSDYKDVNLKKEKATPDSHYRLYTSLLTMRQSDVIRNGDLKTVVMKDDVLAVIRNTSAESVAFLMNFSTNKTITVNLTEIIPHNLSVSLSSLGSKVAMNTHFVSSKITVPPASSLVLRDPVHSAVPL